MIRINNPQTPNSEILLSLGGFTYSLFFTYNRFDERWRLTLSKAGEVIMLNVKITEQRSLIRVKVDPVGFNHGDLICLETKATSNLCGRDNFGLDKEYELLYFTNEELDLG